MKNFLSTVALSILFTFRISNAQNITNTLGTLGVFTIKDASTDYLTLSQSTGQVNILNSLRLEVTGNSSTTGVTFKGTDRFIHDYKPINADGFNTFLGINSGNFTMNADLELWASYNTGVGYGSLTNLTKGYKNTALGSHSLYSNILGYENTASGGYSLFSNTIGTRNTSSGYQSLYSNTGGSYNTASGAYSLYSNTGGANNTTSGAYSLYSNTTGIDNTASGFYSLSSNTTGWRNTAVGSRSLDFNELGSDNTALGYESLTANWNGDYNTALGSYSLKNNGTGLYNTGSGYGSLYYNYGGYDNTAMGAYSLQYNTNGFYNTALGSRTGSTITTGNNLTCLGFDAEPSSPTAANEITLGNSAVTSLRCAVTTITSLSDARDKKNIKELNLGIDFLMKIKPRQFNWDKREWYEGNISDGSKMKEEPTAGFIAQELNEAQTTGNAEWLNLVLKDNPEKWEATPGNLLPIVIKAIQDLKSEKNIEIGLLKEENQKLKVKNQNFEERLAKFEENQNILAKKIEQLELNEQNIKVDLVLSEENNQ